MNDDGARHRVRGGEESATGNGAAHSEDAPECEFPPPPPLVLNCLDCGGGLADAVVLAGYARCPLCQRDHMKARNAEN